MLIIEVLATETLSLTTAVTDITSYIPDQVGAGEGIALIFEGDHAEMVHIGNADQTLSIPFPSGEYGEISIFRRDSMEDNLGNMWADAATDCTVSFVLIR